MADDGNTRLSLRDLYFFQGVAGVRGLDIDFLRGSLVDRFVRRNWNDFEDCIEEFGGAGSVLRRNGIKLLDTQGSKVLGLGLLLQRINFVPGQEYRLSQSCAQTCQ